MRMGPLLPLHRGHFVLQCQPKHPLLQAALKDCSQSSPKTHVTACPLNWGVRQRQGSPAVQPLIPHLSPEPSLNRGQRRPSRRGWRRAPGGRWSEERWERTEAVSATFLEPRLYPAGNWKVPARMNCPADNANFLNENLSSPGFNPSAEAFRLQGGPWSSPSRLQLNPEPRVLQNHIYDQERLAGKCKPSSHYSCPQW
ncbi:uncharacterized protein LOC132529060 [Lagenorhynchus albirostris]|uniref:uncharacterized protein LOC132529060 n=1 Tax=Lagenorhynchus albirostris TaxID=27610 RepID=UPI0028F02665|nr:uncharacterized protein LOC132529060 [Lagenorhynchus albirostris]